MTQIVLPTGDFSALQKLGPDVWRDFWNRIERGAVHDMMTSDQRRIIRRTLEFFAWANEHSSRVEPIWDGLRKQLEAAGTVSSVQRALDDPYPVADVLYTFLAEVESCFPVRMSYSQA